MGNTGRYGKNTPRPLEFEYQKGGMSSDLPSRFLCRFEGATLGNSTQQEAMRHLTIIGYSVVCCGAVLLAVII